MFPLLKSTESLFCNSYFKNAVIGALLVSTSLSYVFLIIYFSKSELSGDDLSYFQHVDVTWSWIINERYLNWSSRILIDSMIPFFVHHILLLKSISLALLFISPFALYKLFDCKFLISVLFCFSVIALFPYYEMQTAGFAATVINYYFPLVCGLILCAVTCRSRSLNIPVFIVLLILGFFSCNHEQCAVIIFVYSALSLIYTQESLNFRALVVVVISLISLVVIGIAPGNSVRLLAETQNWMPEFADFSVFDKVYMGITTAFYNLCYHNNLPFVFCFVSVVLCLTGRLRWTAVAFIVLTVCQEILRPVFKSSQLLEDASWLHNFPSLSLVIFFLYVVILLVFLTRIDMPIKVRIALVLMILLAFALKFLIGFSPTVFASGVRTAIFSQCLFVLCGGYVLMQSNTNKNKVCVLLTYFVLANFHKFILGYITFS
ncbi:MAG: hypothetical protein ACI4NE_04940 [Succinivibrio sp.]